MYKLETHLHVLGTSPCAKTDEKTIAEIYKDKGYDGIIYCSHYNSFLLGYYGMTAREYNANFVAHYEKLKEECAKVGVDVFFGMEFMPDCTSYYNAATPDKAEFQIFGITPEFVLDGGEKLFPLSVKDVSELCKEKGWMFSQTHPFRNMITYRNGALLEACEAFNGHMGHSNGNDLAAKWCEENGLIPLSGSDFHEPHQATCGVLLENAVKNSDELLAELRKRRHTLIKVGN